LIELNNQEKINLDFSGHYENRLRLFKVQVLLSFFSFGVSIWKLVTLVKGLLLKNYDFEIYFWAYPFFHPLESSLFNYIFTGIAVGICGICFYFLDNKTRREFIKKKVALKKLSVLPLLILSLLILLAVFVLRNNSVIIGSFIVTIIPFLYLYEGTILKRNSTQNILLIIFLILISIEPLTLVIEPVLLMNEFINLDSETRIEGQYFRNFDYLRSLKNIDIEQFKLKMLLENSLAIPYQNLPQKQLDNVYDNQNTETYLRLKKIYKNNELEYAHQNMERGQINHIGQILNSINEYDLGKPLNTIYMQYGLGNTFILKWTMKLFGGTSIENYYKCYIYYVVYFLSFLLMLFVLFEETIYVLLGFLFLVLAFFVQGHIGFILAPGILPSIHFLDTFTLISLLRFLKCKKDFFAFLTLVLSVFAILINRQFGIILGLSSLLAFSLYTIENSEKKRMFYTISVFVTFFIFSYLFIQMGTGEFKSTFFYFLIGLFSWPAKSFVIVLTILYLIVSYYFLILLKLSRHVLKYIYVMIFFYTQGLLIYFYWSGLGNHLPAILPFSGLQLLVMFYMLEKEIVRINPKGHSILLELKEIILLFLLIGILVSVQNFYFSKIKFSKNFTNHKTFNWQFKNANLISTINPEPLKESIDLIHRYSKTGKNIYIISKYDNLIPFLAGRYNSISSFDLRWRLLTKSDTEIAINRVFEDKPEYIFVDEDIDKTDDPWANLFTDDFNIRERFARIGRYKELAKVFNGFARDYQKIETGGVLSVYERKASINSP
jgi:hypothetical protein